MAVYWDARWAEARRALKPLLESALGIGFAAVVLALDCEFAGENPAGAPPPGWNPLRPRPRWKELAQIAARNAATWKRAAGKPVFHHRRALRVCSPRSPFICRRPKAAAGGEAAGFFATPAAQAAQTNSISGRITSDARAGRHFRGAEVDRPQLRPRLWFFRLVGTHRGDLTFPTLRYASPAARIARTFENDHRFGCQEVTVSGKGVLPPRPIFRLPQLAFSTDFAKIIRQLPMKIKLPSIRSRPFLVSSPLALLPRRLRPRRRPKIKPGRIWLRRPRPACSGHGGASSTWAASIMVWRGTARGTMIAPCATSVVYSSENLGRWKFPATASKLADPENFGAPWVLERPKVFYNAKTKKSFHVHATLTGGARAGRGATTSPGRRGPSRPPWMGDTSNLKETFPPAGHGKPDIGQFVDDTGTA